MTPLDIANLPVLRTGGFSEACNTNDWDGMPDGFCFEYAKLDKLPRVYVHVHGEVIEDERRFWRVFSVHREGDGLVAVGRMAGREGDDSYDRWVVNIAAYDLMCGDARALMDVIHGYETCPMSQDIGDVLTWYGQTVKPGERIRRFP